MSLTAVKAGLARIHWSLWTLMVALVLYTVLGFWGVPQALRYVLTKQMADQWQRPVQLGEIQFNPFDISLTVSDFAIGNVALSAQSQAQPAVQQVDETAQLVSSETQPSEALAEITHTDITALAAEPVLHSNAVHSVEVATSAAGDLLRFSRLHINFHVASLFKKQIGFEVIELQQPYVRLQVDEQGQLELLKVLLPQPPKAVDPKENSPDSLVVAEHLEPVTVTEAEALDASVDNAASNDVTADNETIPVAVASDSSAVSDNTEPASALLPVWLAALRIEQGELDFVDLQRKGFAQKVLLSEIEIDDFHTTREDSSNRISIRLNDQQSGDISFRTEHFRLQPFHLNGALSISQLALQPVWQWLDLPVNFSLDAPMLDLNTRVALTEGDQFNVQTRDGSLRLQGIQLSALDDADKKLISLQQLQLDGIEFDLQQQSVVLAALDVSGVALDLVLDKQGQLNLLPLFETNAAEQPAQKEQEAADPWRVLIGATHLHDSRVSFVDQQPRQGEFAVLLDAVDIKIGALEPLNQAQPFDVQLAAGLVDGKQSLSPGRIAAQAKIQQQPLQLQAGIDIEQLPLVLAQPYVADFIRGRITRGELGARLSLEMQEALQLQGDVAVEDFYLQQLRGRASLLSLDKLQLQQLDYRAADNRLGIQGVTLSKLGSNLRINEDGSTNLQDLFIEQPADNEKVADKPLQLAINTVSIDNADLGFADRTLSQNFQVAIKSLSGKISNISSDPEKMAHVDLAGKVDHYAPVTVKGTFNAFGEHPALDMAVKFDNLELTSLTPYSGTYAGFAIKRGQLNIDLDYQLQNHKIAGKNKIVMDQLTLGEKVDSPKAVDLPLRLALALLRDEKGVIDLGFEVNGDLNDPAFSVGGILWKVLTNIVKKAVASPMKALGILGGASGGGDGDAIAFAVGSADLSDETRQQMQTLKAALDKRSELRLSLQGNVDPNTDGLSLQRQRLAAELSRGDEKEVTQWLQPELAADSRSMRRRLARYYQHRLDKSYDDVEATIALQFPGLSESQRAERVFAAVFDELAVQQAVSRDALRQLAMDRALALRAYLTDELGFGPERVSVVDYNTDAARAGSNCLLQLGI